MSALPAPSSTTGTKRAEAPGLRSAASPGRTSSEVLKRSNSARCNYRMPRRIGHQPMPLSQFGPKVATSAVPCGSPTGQKPSPRPPRLRCCISCLLACRSCRASRASLRYRVPPHWSTLHPHGRLGRHRVHRLLRYRQQSGPRPLVHAVRSTLPPRPQLTTVGSRPSAVAAGPLAAFPARRQLSAQASPMPPRPRRREAPVLGSPSIRSLTLFPAPCSHALTGQNRSISSQRESCERLRLHRLVRVGRLFPSRLAGSAVAPL